MTTQSDYCMWLTVIINRTALYKPLRSVHCHIVDFGLQSTVKSTVILYMLGFLRLIEDLRSVDLLWNTEN